MQIFAPFRRGHRQSDRSTVCVDCRYIRERPSGVATLAQAIVDYVPGLAPDLDFLFLKHPNGPERLSSEPNVREQVVPQEANGPATLLWFPTIVDLHGADLYHNMFNILPLWLRIPSVVTVNDVMWIKHPDWAKGPGWWGHVEVAYFQAGLWRALQYADRIMTISEASRSEILSIAPQAAGRTHVALEGISPDFHPIEEPERTRLLQALRARYLHGAPRYVLTVGQFAVYKNHVRVLRAFAKAFADQPDMHLAFVQRLGCGPAALRPIATQLGVDSRVHFLSNVPLIDLVALYNGATALCHPSLYEGFGNPPAEAIACGCPVVTSNRSSMPEVSGVASMLVDPENVDEIASALSVVASDQQLAASMRQRGLRRASELTWKAFAEGNLACYRDVLARRTRLR
jgi:glycosyltransferase involved in cell wall biosynthesis